MIIFFNNVYLSFPGLSLANLTFFAAQKCCGTVLVQLENTELRETISRSGASVLVHQWYRCATDSLP